MIWRLFISLGLVFSQLQAQENTSPSKTEKPPKVITLEEFVKVACGKNSRFKELLAEKARLRFKRIVQSEDDDIFLDVEAEYGLQLSPQTDSENTISVGLSKLFLNTGTETSVAYSVSPSVSNGVNMPNYALEASVIQPVLNNAFGYQTRLDEKIFDLEEDIARHQIIEAYEEYLATITKAYFQWFSNFARLETAQAAHNDNLRVLREMRARRRRNIALPVDVNKIELRALKSEADIIRIENEYLQASEIIREAMVVKDIASFKPELPENYTQISPDFGKGFAKIKKESRTFLILNLLKKKAGYELDKYTNDLLPTANLTATYSLSSTKPTFQRDNNHDVFIGFSVSYPLFNTQARAQKKSAAIFLRQTKMGNVSKSNQLKAQLRNVYTGLKTLTRLVALAEKQIVKARSILAAERRYFQRGRISLNDLIRASNEVDSQRFLLNDLRVERNILYVEWLRLSDQLVIKLPQKKGDDF